MTARFNLGRLVATPGALETLTHENIFSLLARHSSGDWGEMSQDDMAANDLAVKDGGERVFSSYHVGGTKVWIITEADRSATTVLLPSEY